MYHISWSLNIKLFYILITTEGILCSIDGTFHPRRPNATNAVDDPCNPLYWYPRHIPESCYYKKDMTVKPPFVDLRPIPMPLPVPIPPIPVPMPMPIPPPMLPPIIPQAIMPLPYPLPFGIPLAPTNPMLPVAGIPYPPQPMFPPQPMQPPQYPQPAPYQLPPHLTSPFASYVPPYGIQRKPMSMVPGLPGLVAPDGGINILPFSDAYADMLEKHKQKMIRLRLQKLLDEYDGINSDNSYEELSHMMRSRNDITEDNN